MRSSMPIFLLRFYPTFARAFSSRATVILYVCGFQLVEATILVREVALYLYGFADLLLPTTHLRIEVPRMPESHQERRERFGARGDHERGGDSTGSTKRLW